MRARVDFTTRSLTGCGVERVVDVVCHPGCSAPIIATVLDKRYINSKLAGPGRRMYSNSSHV